MKAAELFPAILILKKQSEAVRQRYKGSRLVRGRKFFRLG
jgi:hypothetical protein